MIGCIYATGGVAISNTWPLSLLGSKSCIVPSTIRPWCSLGDSTYFDKLLLATCHYVYSSLLTILCFRTMCHVILWCSSTLHVLTHVSQKSVVSQIFIPPIPAGASCCLNGCLFLIKYHCSRFA